MSDSNLSQPATSEHALSLQVKAIGEIAQGVAQIGNGLATLGRGVAEAGQTFAPLQAALQDVQQRQKSLGGFMGLLRLLRDKELQRTIHLLTVVPALLDRLGQAEAPASEPKGTP